VDAAVRVLDVLEEVAGLRLVDSDSGGVLGCSEHEREFVFDGRE
jgi:hypothetical protein